MIHTIDIEHPAVTKLLIANPREFVETLPVPADGCYTIEFGRVHVGGVVQDVLRAHVRKGAHPERGDGRTELLLLQPTTGELTIATISHAGILSEAARSEEHAYIEPLREATRLMRFEDDSADDPIRQIRRDVVPVGDATSIEGTLDILMALSHRDGVGRDVNRAIHEAVRSVTDAMHRDEHVRRIVRIRDTGEPEGDIRNRGMRAMSDGLATGMMQRQFRGHSRHMPYETHGHHPVQNDREVRDFLGRADHHGKLSVDGGEPRPVDDVVVSYGDERSPYRQVLVDGALMTGTPTFTGDVCVVRAEDRTITLRIAV
jgi:hypothetical protein